MPSVLLLLLLVILFSDPVAATSPILDPTSPTITMDFPEFDGAFAAFCNCAGTLHTCVMFNSWPSQNNMMESWSSGAITRNDLVNHPEWPVDWSLFPPSPSPSPPPAPAAAPAPLPEPLDNDGQTAPAQPINETAIGWLQSQATTVGPAAVQEHVDAIYLPGDRIETAAEPPRRRFRRVDKAYPCLQCGKAFDRKCDLQRHARVHVPSSDRPHKCDICNDGFQYPKDLRRHQRRHRSPDSSQESLHYCATCGAGFPRRDNLLRHQRKQHPAPAA